MSRVLCWFSAGGPSAVATALGLAKYGDRCDIYYIDPGSEHEDNLRFVRDCETWFDHPVNVVRSDRYRDTWQVWDERRFLVGPTGALCTVELKKKLRYAIQQPDDLQVFGYTADEEHRAEQFRSQNIGIELLTPLIDRGLNRNDCLGILDRAGIELPAMYRLGYTNANCIGCPKGGMGYWNKIRVDFPGAFDRMAKLEREIGHSIQKDADGSVWLDELDPERGDYPTEAKADCSLLCVLAEDEVAPYTQLARKGPRR